MKFIVEIVEARSTSTCSKGESVLASMVRSNIKRIPSGCHGGGCGVCKIRILAGQYETGKMNRNVLTIEEEREGFSLACKTFAEEDLEITVVGHMKKFYGNNL